MLEEIKQNRNDFPVRKQRPRKTSVYACSHCKFESKRKYNVLRHQERMHPNKKLHVCCGKKLLTKDEYYIHCEKNHPDKVETFSSSEEEESLHGWQLDRRYSERLRTKCEKNMQSRVRNKVTYNDLDLENIPLNNFLTDRRLKPYMKRLSVSSGVNKTNENPDKDSQQSVEILISSEQDTEKAVVLPTKKLILQRFRRSAARKFGVPLREQNNNDKK